MHFYNKQSKNKENRPRALCPLMVEAICRDRRLHINSEAEMLILRATAKRNRLKDDLTVTNIFPHKTDAKNR